MAKLIRGLVVIGAIAILSPVHEGSSLRTDITEHGRSLLTTMMPEPDFRTASTAAQTAMTIARQIKDLDPATRDMMLQMAAAHLGHISEQHQHAVSKGAKNANMPQ